MSYDTKYRQRAIEYWSEGNSKEKTAEVFKVSPTTLQKWKSLLKETGTLAPKKRKQIWRKIEPAKLRKYIAEHPEAYLREIAAEFGCSIHAVKKTIVYRERCEKTRRKFVSRIKRISGKNLIYVDEAGIEECLFREYARAPIGQKVIAQVNGKKFERTNLIAGICLGRWVAPRQYKCTTDSDLVVWFEHCLLK